MREGAAIRVFQTSAYSGWFDRLGDGRARALIIERVRRLERGLFGDAKGLGGGLAELRIDYGPGYRIYFVRRGTSIVVLLAGGDKSRQSADIVKARELAAGWSDEP